MWVGKVALYTPPITDKRVLPVDAGSKRGLKLPFRIAGQPTWLRLVRKTMDELADARVKGLAGTGLCDKLRERLDTRL